MFLRCLISTFRENTAFLWIQFIQFRSIEAVYEKTKRGLAYADNRADSYGVLPTRSYSLKNHKLFFLFVCFNLFSAHVF